MQIPLSILKPFGPIRTLDELLEAYVVDRLMQLGRELNKLSPDARRRRYENMDPLLRAVLKGLHAENVQ
jgi:hypothetical protein